LPQTRALAVQYYEVFGIARAREHVSMHDLGREEWVSLTEYIVLKAPFQGYIGLAL
jgi:hypothetical protein